MEVPKAKEIRTPTHRVPQSLKTVESRLLWMLTKLEDSVVKTIMDVHKARRQCGQDCYGCSQSLKTVKSKLLWMHTKLEDSAKTVRSRLLWMLTKLEDSEVKTIMDAHKA